MSSCVVPYDAETRLLFETQIVDSNENALSNVDVEINVKELKKMAVKINKNVRNNVDEYVLKGKSIYSKLKI